MSIKSKPGKGVRRVEVFSRTAEEKNVVREAFGALPSPWLPRVDIYEQGEDLVVEVELPGVEHRDLSLIVHANRLELSGKKREDEAAQGGHYIRLEREYGFFSRFIPLPCLVFPDHSQAWLEDGVLVVRLKKYRKK